MSINLSLKFLSDEEIIDITSFNVNEKFDIYDSRFGTFRNNSKCVLCDKTIKDCFGHYGNLFLGTKIFHPMFFAEIANAMNSICHECYYPLSRTQEYSNKRGGRCKRCESTCYVDYYIPSNYPYALRRKTPNSTTTPDISPNVVYNALTNANHPSKKYIISYVIVPPIGIRPPEDVEWPSDLSKLYIRLIETVKSRPRDNSYVKHITDIYSSIVGYSKKDGVIKALSGKKGIFRTLMLGKRLNRSMRLVITGDPNLDVDQVLLSKEIASKVRVTEKVWDGNVEKMKYFANHGELWWPSEEINATSNEVLIGLEFDRALQDNDMIMFNRQPSLSRTSLLGFRLKITSKNSNVFSFNPVVTTAFNADFDGDEMNAFVGQDLLAKAELVELCHVNKNIYDKVTKSIAIQLIQDSITGVYMMTKNKQIISKDLYFDCANIINSTKMLERNKSSLDTYDLFSLCLPNDLNFENNLIIIRNGLLIEGVINKSIITNKLIVHMLEIYGYNITVKFIRDVQLIVIRWMDTKGFSVSLTNCITAKKLLEDKESNNPLANMIYSGSKGNELGISQISLSVGQQFVRGQKCIINPMSKKPEDNGFVSSSYVNGLNPKEYLAHSIGAREGVINTGVSTAITGYLNRRACKIMADIKVDYGNTISDVNNIISFINNISK